MWVRKIQASQQETKWVKNGFISPPPPDCILLNFKSVLKILLIHDLKIHFKFPLALIRG